MRKYTLWIVALILLVVFAPVLITQVSKPVPRQYRGERLENLEYQEILFTNHEQNINLAGMLFIPEGEGPFPAVVMIHGSGTSRRENIWYVTVAAHLQKNGVVVLLPDKRGSVNSEGNWRTSSFEDLATDTVAAMQYLQTQAFAPISEVGIIGFSQGGWIAPIVASQTNDVSFLVNIVGTSVTTYEQLMYEENYNLREIGFLPGISNLISYPSIFVLRNISQKDFWGAVGNYDPLPYWQNVSVPVLVLYGDEDTNVPSLESKTRFESLNQENITVKMYAGSGHALQDPLGEGDSIFRSEALNDIIDFIQSATQ